MQPGTASHDMTWPCRKPTLHVLSRGPARALWGWPLARGPADIYRSLRLPGYQADGHWSGEGGPDLLSRCGVGSPPRQSTSLSAMCAESKAGGPPLAPREIRPPALSLSLSL